MIRPLVPATAILTTTLLISGGLCAQDVQEQTQVKVRIEKNGQVLQDTTFRFEDTEEARHAIKMMEMLSGEEVGTKNSFSYALSDGNNVNTMVFVSKDGDKTEIREITGDSLVWVSEDEGEDGQVKVIRKQLKDTDREGGPMDGEQVRTEDGNVYVIRKGKDQTIEILEGDEDGGDLVKKKEVTVIVSDDDQNVVWNVDSEDQDEQDENVYVIKKDDDLKAKLEKILDEHGDADQVKVVVVEKNKGKETDKKSHKKSDKAPSKKQ